MTLSPSHDWVLCYYVMRHTFGTFDLGACKLGAITNFLAVVATPHEAVPVMSSVLSGFIMRWCETGCHGNMYTMLEVITKLQWGWSLCGCGIHAKYKMYFLCLRFSNIYFHLWKFRVHLIFSKVHLVVLVLPVLYETTRCVKIWIWNNLNIIHW